MHKAEYKYLLPYQFEERLNQAPVAYLPLGTIEWHGEHLPLGSDGIQAEELFFNLADAVGGIVFPMLFLAPDSKILLENGKELYGMDSSDYDWIPENQSYTTKKRAGSCYYIEDKLFSDIITASIKQIARAGFKILVAHGHGPSINYIEEHKDELSERFNITIMSCVNSESTIDGYMCDHAAKNETSIIMHYYPSLAQINRLPADHWPEGVAGADPRINASKKYGDEVVLNCINYMSSKISAALKNI